MAKFKLKNKSKIFLNKTKNISEPKSIPKQKCNFKAGTNSKKQVRFKSNYSPAKAIPKLSPQTNLNLLLSAAAQSASPARASHTDISVIFLFCSQFKVSTTIPFATKDKKFCSNFINRLFRFLLVHADRCKIIKRIQMLILCYENAIRLFLEMACFVYSLRRQLLVSLFCYISQWKVRCSSLSSTETCCRHRTALSFTRILPDTWHILYDR